MITTYIRTYVGQNIDRQQLDQLYYVAILLEPIEREKFNGLLRNLTPNLSMFPPCYTVYVCTYVFTVLCTYVYLIYVCICGLN